MGVIYIGGEAEYRKILGSAGKKLVVVDFFATWCGPCKAISGPYENLAKKYAKGAIFLKVDVDQNQAISSEAKVTAMPTFHVYREKALVGQVTGANLGEVESIILKHYKEVDSFSGSGAKLGSSGGDTAPANPFHELFLANRRGDTQPEQDESEVVDVTLQLRLWDGSTVKAEFPSNATLQKVSDYVATLPNAPSSFTLTTQYPKRTYQGDLLHRTLHQENLTKRGQLTVTTPTPQATTTTTGSSTSSFSPFNLLPSWN